MTQRPDAPDEPERKKPARPKPLPAARDDRSPGSNGRRQRHAVPPHRPAGARRTTGDGGHERSPRKASRKPTPVRAMAREPSGPAIERDAEEVELTAEGTGWIARVLGRSGRARRGGTPLLLVGFWRAGAVSGDPAREAFVVARALATAPVRMLERACEAAQDVPASDS